MSTDYNGYYIREPGKSDKYGFTDHLPKKSSMRLDVFLNSSTKFKISKLIFAFKFKNLNKMSQVGPFNHFCSSFAVCTSLLRRS